MEEPWYTVRYRHNGKGAYGHMTFIREAGPFSDHAVAEQCLIVLCSTDGFDGGEIVEGAPKSVDIDKPPA